MVVNQGDNEIHNLAEQIYQNEDQHVTVIVGSGASGSSPSTKNLKDRVLEKYGRMVFDTHARYSFGKKSSKHCTLEELFSIYAGIKENLDKEDTDSVSDFLRTTYSPPDNNSDHKKKIVKRTDLIKPTIGYEFLAHLVHHKLINTVITTNFDEELEISLDDEIGKENYRIVKSLDEFDAIKEEIERNQEKLFEKPILFKVHGTISYPSTLRPTKNSVQKFEKQKNPVITKLLTITDVLLIVGYSFRDFDFIQSFIESTDIRSKESEMQIYWIDHDRRNLEKDYKNELQYERLREAIQKVTLKENNPSFIDSDSNKFFVQIADCIEEIDKKHKKIPTILRHKIRNMILERSDLDKIRENKFLLEIIIYAIKAKGLFGLNSLTDCVRIQRYSQDVLEFAKKKSLNYLLLNLTRKGIIKEVDHRIGIYYVPISGKNEKTKMAKKLIEFFNLKSKFTLGKEELLQDHLSDLEDVFDVDIVKPDASTSLMFNNPVPIRNHEEWADKTNEFFEKSKVLKIIAQTGEWLTKETELFENFFMNKGKMQLIICEKFDNTGMHSDRQETKVWPILKKMEDTYKEQIEILFLPWDVIFEHIKLNDKDKGIRGIYMKRIGKSPTVAPVLINEKEDHAVLKRMFKYYWQKAKDYTFQAQSNNP